MSKNIIKTNSDFLFIYEAKNTNPNGDPDMENKPRMDYETKTNLVTDLRIKRNIREYLKDSGHRIFVDTLSEQKVSAEKMLNHIVEETTGNPDKLGVIVSGNEKLKKLWENLLDRIESDEKTYAELRRNANAKAASGRKDENLAYIKEQFPKLNNLLLREIISKELIDIRMFGGAFAVGGFSSTYTGPVQLNWGYSLHPVEMIKSNTISAIMSSSEKDASTFGKDYRLYYSLIAFHGTVNKYLAQKSGLTPDDVQLFRESIINSISYKPTRSKSDQYAMMYLELEYDEKYNGYLRDLRDFITCHSERRTIRSIKDLKLDFSKFETLIKENIENIKHIHLWKTPLPGTDFEKFGAESDDTVKAKIKPVSLKSN
ncbi:MAG: type I CRISPR-associated protein Cas7 [Desulfococcaceae bacterium]|jgi:CRISPR-associated protein Csh2|nr:type I CRISPR-associated protein Cas7 [Desulfococcaceae bacterium]